MNNCPFVVLLLLVFPVAARNANADCPSHFALADLTGTWVTGSGHVVHVSSGQSAGTLNVGLVEQSKANGSFEIHNYTAVVVASDNRLGLVATSSRLTNVYPFQLEGGAGIIVVQRLSLPMKGEAFSKITETKWPKLKADDVRLDDAVIDKSWLPVHLRKISEGPRQ